MARPYIDFMGNRKWLFIASGVLLTIAIVSLIVRGLVFGIEFKGGTVITFANAGKVSVTQMRNAAEKQKLAEPVVQTIQGGGFILRTAEPDPTRANAAADAMMKEFGLSRNDVNVETISPSWGANITNRALIALLLSIAAILVYVSFRFEYKMSVTAVVALVHDVIITLGLYALIGREVTPNTVAALLTILGYSLYDTIVVFHRIKENSQRIVKQTFMQMANDSINQVLMRWVNTGLSSIIPVIVLLLIGGETLKDFAFALVIGLISGAYSSVAVASPLYAMWKETEPKFRALAKKHAK